MKRLLTDQQRGIVEEIKAIAQRESAFIAAVAKDTGGKPHRSFDYNNWTQILSSADAITACDDGKFSHCLPAEAVD